MKRQHPENPDLFWCPKCQTYKARGEFYIERRDYNGISCRCKLCMRKHVKQWANSNPQRTCQLRHDQYLKHRNKRLASNRDRYKRNKSSYLEKQSLYAKEHPEVHLLANRNYRKKNRIKLLEESRKATENLSERYIKGKLRRDKIVINPETIELKRQQIIMKRTLKQFKDWRKEHESVNQDVAAE